MEKYDPQIAPIPEDWLALDEDERISLVKTWHRKAKVKLPDANLHAVFHAIVENQLAQGQKSVREALARLRKEGLDRHDALHAIASVLVEHMHEFMARGHPDQDLDAAYLRRLEKLTAESWLNS